MANTLYWQTPVTLDDDSTGLSSGKLIFHASGSRPDSLPVYPEAGELNITATVPEQVLHFSAGGYLPPWNGPDNFRKRPGGSPMVVDFNSLSVGIMPAFLAHQQETTADDYLWVIMTIKLPGLSPIHVRVHRDHWQRLQADYLTTGIRSLVHWLRPILTGQQWLADLLLNMIQGTSEYLDTPEQLAAIHRQLQAVLDHPAHQQFSLELELDSLRHTLPTNWPAQRPGGKKHPLPDSNSEAPEAKKACSDESASHSGGNNCNQHEQKARGGGGSGGDENEHPFQREVAGEPDLLEQVFASAASGDAAAVRDYLKKGGRVNIRNNNNQTLLHVALQHEHLNVAGVLLEYDAGIDDETDNNQQTPLDYAARHSVAFLHRFLMLAYGEHGLENRMRSTRTHIQFGHQTGLDYLTAPGSVLCQRSERLIRYHQSQHGTPDEFRDSDDFPLFIEQFENNIAQLEEWIKTIFSEPPSDLLQKLDKFRRDVVIGDSEFIPFCMSLVYGKIHENIHLIVGHLESLSAFDDLQEMIKDLFEDICLEFHESDYVGDVEEFYYRTQSFLTFIAAQKLPEARIIRALRWQLACLVCERLPHDHPKYLQKSMGNHSESRYMNGYLNDLSVKPVHGVEGAIWQIDRRDIPPGRNYEITPEQHEAFAQRAAARIDAAQVIYELADQALDNLKNIFPPETDITAIPSNRLTGEITDSLHRWFKSLEIILPGDLKLQDLIYEKSGHYSFGLAAFRLRQAITRFLSDKRWLPEGTQTRLCESSPIWTLHHLVYWTGDEHKNPVTFKDLQALLQEQKCPVHDQLIMEVIWSTFSFSRQLYLLDIILSSSEPTSKERLLKAWYEHILEHGSLKGAFVRLVGIASPDYFRQTGLFDHYDVLFDDYVVGRRLLKRLIAPDNTFTDVAFLKTRLLTDAKVQTTATLEYARELSQQEKNMLLNRLAAEGNAELLADFLKLALVDVNSIGQQGCSALQLAAFEGHEGVVKLLIDNEADISSVSRDGWCALRAAAAKGHQNIVELLIKNKADINHAPLMDDNTALDEAIFNNYIEIARILLQNKADVNRINSISGWAPLFNAIHRGDKEMVELLISHRANVRYVNQKDGYNVLMQAAEGNQTEMVELLIRHGADVNYVNQEDGDSVLMAAADKGGTEVVDLLIKGGADVNYVNPQDGMTALIVAASNGCMEIVELLIGHGVDVSCINKEDVNGAIMAADSEGHTEVAELLLAFRNRFFR